MTTTDRQARFRSTKRDQGYKQQSIWLSKEDDEIIRAAIERDGLKNRSEVIRYALRTISNQEPKMQT